MRTKRELMRRTAAQRIVLMEARFEPEKEVAVAKDTIGGGQILDWKGSPGCEEYC